MTNNRRRGPLTQRNVLSLLPDVFRHETRSGPPPLTPTRPAAAPRRHAATRASIFRPSCHRLIYSYILLLVFFPKNNEIKTSNRNTVEKYADRYK